MKILYTNFHEYSGGGHDTYIISIVMNMPLDTYVACPSSSSLYKKLNDIGYKNLYAVNFPGKPKEIRSICVETKKLIRIIKENCIDIVHTNGSSDNRLALYAKILSGLKFKVVFTKHNSFPINGLISKLRFKLFNDAIILVSDSIRQNIGFRVNERKLNIIKNGVDVNKWLPVYQRNSQQINLVSTAGTKDYKGWHYLIKALKTMSPLERSKFKITIAGDTPSEGKLSEIFGNDKAGINVIFPGHLDDTREILNDADIGFVLSDSIETISFACREMMSSGLPVIVSDFGGLSENISHGKDGWITQVGNVDHIANKLKYIASIDDDSLFLMKKAAREKAEENFSLDKMINETHKLYLGL